MHKLQVSQSCDLQISSNQDQKTKLQQMLRERFSLKGKKQKQVQPKMIVENNLKINSNPNKKQYSSQATQIQEDLLDMDLEDRLRGDQDEDEGDEDLNNSYDKSFYHTINMQSRYDESILKQEEQDASYFIKNNYFRKNQRQQDELAKKKQDKNYASQSIINKNLSPNFNSVIRRYSNNLIFLKQDNYNERQKQVQPVDSTQSQILPQINNNYQADQKADIKKRIQINRKEVYKVFCSKMQEEEESKKQLQQSKENANLFLSSQYPITSIRNSIYRTKQSSINDNSILSNKKILPFSSPQNEFNYGQKRDQFSKNISRRSSIEDPKFDYQNWNLADFTLQMSGKQPTPDKYLVSSSLYKNYSKKLLEKKESSNNQSKVNQPKTNLSLPRRESLSLISKCSIQLEPNNSDNNLLEQHYEIQPKRLLKKFFSVKQLSQTKSLNSPMRCQRDEKQGNFNLVKQMEEFRQQNQDKQKSDTFFIIQFPQIGFDKKNNRSSSTDLKNNKKLTNEIKPKLNLQIKVEENEQILPFNKQILENYFQ